MNKWLITTCAAGSLAMAAVVWAGPGGDEGGPRGGPRGGPGGGRGHGGPERGLEALMHNPELAKDVGVTEEQLTALKNAAYAHKKNEIKLRGDAELAKLEVKNLMQADPVDKTAVMAAVETAGKGMIELRKAQISFMLQMKEIVGKDTMQKIRQHMREGRQGQGRGGPEGEKKPGEGRGRGKGPGFGQNENQGGPPWMQDEMMAPDDMDDENSAI